jgi:hypothetical protein
LVSAISILRSSPQVHAACSAWAQSQPASSLHQSVPSAAPLQSVPASQVAQRQPLHQSAKSVGHAQLHAAMHQLRAQLHHAQRHEVIAGHDQSVHRALSARHVRIASHESVASAAKQRQR